ncbi:hypothetical protein EUGRSUZ_G00417 [Eucalyptus grandis]|uniref:Uncharacterized protein n=2 Tax=Eucalyptus grandis TaxID=71139 RepID=A0ACC3JZR3_EUCGR|nr:hypothetical protein EUGRSUZ_G00417 [Eucalyptus grandis]
MAEVVLSIVSGCLVAPVNRLCDYLISYEGDVSELEAKVAELGIARQRVKDSINYALNNAKPIRAYVNEWVEDVEKDTDEARRVLDDDERAEKTCFYGRLPNLKVRYRLSREVRRKAKDIQRLIDQNPSGQVYDDPPLGLVDGASNMISLAGDRGDTIFESRASILKDIMNALDDEKHKVIGIYGPGGVGKTTLLEEVEEKLRKEGKPFQMIVKAEVSQTPDVNNIQGQIADVLKLDLKDKESQQGRRDLLCQRLQKDPSEKILIILDDLWKEVNLRAVGIPLGGESRGNHVLLTSRYKNVLKQMKCGPQIFHLEGLKNDEAIRLFEKTVGYGLKDKQLKTIADQLVKKLAGLPLLINSVAISLKDMPVAAWSSALKTIDPSHIETVVKWSYNHLKSEDTKTLFLLCGLIGGTIQVEILLVLGMGLGLFEESRLTMQESRDRLYTMLADLRFACLLLDGDDDKKNLTIHDLYSEAVVSTPFRGQNSLMMNSKYGLWRKEKLEKCWAICLPDVGIDRVAELMRYQFPDLEILMLSQPNYSRRMLQDTADCSVLLDFKSMEKLQALYVRSIHIARLPSIGILGNLYSLYLDHCNVDDAAILGKLKALQILSLEGSALSRLPKEIGDLTNLRSLNLSYCDKLRTIEPGVLERLINLEELYLRGSFDQWMGKDGIPSESCNARLAELKSLTKIASLEISIPDPSVLSEEDDFPFGNLIKFSINIGKATGGIIEGLRTMELKLEAWDIILSKEWVKKILQKTQYLYLDGLNTPESIANSPSIESIANSSNGLPLTGFTILESLFLNNLINLERILPPIEKAVSYGAGEVEVLVDDTGGEEVHIDNNPSIESIANSSNVPIEKPVSYGAGEVEVLADDTGEEVLDIDNCPSIESIANSSNGLPLTAFTILEYLFLNNLIYPEKICNGLVAPKCFSILKAVTIEQCH